MATRTLSPTAQLLRTSRLFSLPPVLPYVSNGNPRTQSDTATTPYPTRQAIATTDNALHSGDWGLKRPLPKNAATSTSQPTIRVLEGDTTEQYTDFESANDHARTLLKWQEMDIPMNAAGRRTSMVGRYTGQSGQSGGTTAFNELIDNTSKRRAERLTQEHRARSARGHPLFRASADRWKVEGPDVGEMTEGDFKSWLQHTVSTPSYKNQFLRWLRQKVIDREIAGLRSQHKANALPGNFDEAAALASRDWDEAFANRLKLMRERGLGPDGELNRYLEEFMDLPQRKSDVAPGTVQLVAAKTTYTTHPSAGLSYQTNKSFMRNHNMLGPRADYEPVRARRLNVSGNVALGVGGVAAAETDMHSGGANSRQNYDVYGGSKKWVVPVAASINREGRVQLKVAQARADSVGVKEDELKEAARLRGEGKEESDDGPAITSPEGWGRARGTPQIAGR